MKNFKKQQGFTLIEIMVVVIIIGVLAAMVMPRLAGRSEQAKVSAAQADVSSNISTGLKLYEMDNGHFPKAEEGGLEALLTQPASATAWKGPYLERKAVDPWGRPYEYRIPGTHRTYDYDLFSLGSDGIESDDDVKNWQ